MEPNTEPSTSLRVRFAIAQGYQLTGGGGLMWIHGRPAPKYDPTDANTVREALMGMTEEEWRVFCKLWFQRANFSGRDFVYELIATSIKTPPQTLAEIYCEVKLGKDA